MKKKLLLAALICLCSCNMALAVETPEEAEGQETATGKIRRGVGQMRRGAKGFAKKLGITKRSAEETKKRSIAFAETLADEIRGEFSKDKKTLTEYKGYYQEHIPKILEPLAKIDESLEAIRDEVKKISELEGIATYAWEYPILVRLLMEMIQVTKRGFGRAEESLTEWKIDGNGHRAQAARKMMDIIKTSNLGKYSEEAGKLKSTFSKRHHTSVNYFINQQEKILEILQAFKKKLNNDAYIAEMTKGFEETGKKEVAWAEKAGASFTALLTPIRGFIPQHHEPEELTAGFPEGEQTAIGPYLAYLKEKKAQYYAMENKERELTRNAWEKLIAEKRLSGPVKIKFEQKFEIKLQKSGVVQTKLKDIGKRRKKKGLAAVTAGVSALVRVGRKTKFQKWVTDFLNLLGKGTLLKPGLQTLLIKLNRAKKPKQKANLEKKVAAKRAALKKKSEEFVGIYQHTQEVYERERQNLITDAGGKQITVSRAPATKMQSLETLGEVTEQEAQAVEEEGEQEEAVKPKKRRRRRPRRKRPTTKLPTPPEAAAEPKPEAEPEAVQKEEPAAKEEEEGTPAEIAEIVGEEE